MSQWLRHKSRSITYLLKIKNQYRMDVYICHAATRKWFFKPLEGRIYNTSPALGNDFQKHRSHTEVPNKDVYIRPRHWVMIAKNTFATEFRFEKISPARKRLNKIC